MLQKSLAPNRRNERGRAGSHQWYKCFCTRQGTTCIGSCLPRCCAQMHAGQDPPARTHGHSVHAQNQPAHARQPASEPQGTPPTALRKQQADAGRSIRQGRPAAGCSMPRLAPFSTAQQCGMQQQGRVTHIRGHCTGMAPATAGLPAAACTPCQRRVHPKRVCACMC